jgi:phenylpropionate dioxygenase-like ring-hydroxylating dioxygenase large terminal subunit
MKCAQDNNIKKIQYSGWFALCRSKDLRKQIRAEIIQGIPLVLFRGKDGNVTALLDACCHRQAELSKGKVIDGCIQCPYHGWEFDSQGICQNIPGSRFKKNISKFRVKHFPALEQDGLIWVWVAEKKLEGEKPLRLPFYQDRQFSHVIWEEKVEANFVSTIENLLDPMHTHFVHSGLIRKEGKRNQVKAIIRKYSSSVEVEYQGEEEQSGWIPKLFFNSGKTLKMYGRFFLSGTAQLEYCIDENKRFFLTVLMTPVSEKVTKAIIVNSFAWNLPHFIIKLLAKPFFKKALQQDLMILESQQKNLNRLNGLAKNHDTELDIIAPKIRQLLENPFKEREEEKSERILYL